MNLHLDARGQKDFAFYIDGDLQFDTADEALYHESLVLPALSLAARNAPNAPLRVLICGGGDGLALRECLRFPNVAHVDLVDYSAEVVEWGRTQFATLNQHAFADSRAHVHIADAWEFLQTKAQQTAAVSTSEMASAETDYHVIVCDFTVPRREEDTRVYSVKWYALLRQTLAQNGLLALNAVSPQTAPEAFWCINQTARAAKLSAQPYHVCIPSFRAQGYGAWAFLLAGPHLKRRDLRSLHCPVPTRQFAMTELWQAAQFSHEERRVARRIPPHTLAAPCLLPLLLNPGMKLAAPRLPAAEQSSEGGKEANFPASTAESSTAYDLNALLAAIPITHPYHTRVMIESLAEQVVGTVRHLDIQQLLDALLRRAQSLPLVIQAELTRLQAFLQNRLPRLELFGAWGRKLFVILVVLMTLANTIAPDNAFGKGTSSFGHASMSRGYSGGSFGKGASGFGEGASHSSSGSFSGKPGYGSSFGSQGKTSSGSFHGPAPIIRSTGFRQGYGSGHPTDVEGVAYPTRSFTYVARPYGGGYYGRTHYYGNYGAAQTGSQPGEEHKALFVADDDLIVLDNGDVVITLSDTSYLLLSGANLSLMSAKSADSLMALYADPKLFQNVMAQLRDQQGQVGAAIQARREWLAWVGWTSAFAGVIADDKAELRNMEDLDRRLQTALDQIQMPPDSVVPAAPPESNGVELFVDCQLLQNNRIALRGAGNTWVFTDGKHITAPGQPAIDCPPAFNNALRDILLKLQKEFTGEITSSGNDLRQLAQDKASLDKDLADYQQLMAANGGDPNYQADYGTDEISVSDAISKTQNEQNANQSDTTQTQAALDKTTADLQRVSAALEQLAK